jgi:type I restriction enzyme S subunit
VLEDLRFTDEESYRVWTARATPRFGDIMITREAPLGEVCGVPAGRKVCLGQRMMLYRPAPIRTDSKYFLYSLMSEPVRSNLFRKIGGSTVGHAKVDDIRFLELPLPALPEQRCISEALSDVDGLLSGLDRLIAKKRDLKQSAMQQLLTGQCRLPGFHGEWDTTTLEAACVPGGLVRGPFGGSLKKEIFVSSGKKVYEQRNAIYRDVGIGNYFIDESKFRELQRFAVSPGEFIVSCAGDNWSHFSDSSNGRIRRD